MMKGIWVLSFSLSSICAYAAAPKSVSDKASYAIGHNIGSSVKQQADGISSEQLIQGLKDALAGKKSVLSEKDAREALDKFRAQVTEAQQKKMAVVGEKNKTEGQKFLDANKKKEGVKTTASGLQYKVVKASTGKDAKSPKPTDVVKVHYTGKLTDGTVFDSSETRGEPAKFPVNGVIKGWTEGLQLMKVGDEFEFVIPSDLAYGPTGSGREIGPHAVLTFSVKLLEIEPPQTAEKPADKSSEKNGSKK